jgi:hypothetical protein
MRKIRTARFARPFSSQVDYFHNGREDRSPEHPPRESEWQIRALALASFWAGMTLPCRGCATDKQLRVSRPTHCHEGIVLGWWTADSDPVYDQQLDGTDLGQWDEELRP